MTETATNPVSRLFDHLQYAASEVRKHGRDREWWRHRIRNRINKPVQQRLSGSGVDVPEEDWDVLIVLDACRADAFERVVDTSRFDTYSRVTSRASMTAEWLARVWPDTYGDTVYVAGNPMVSKHATHRWHQLYEAWRDGLDQSIRQVDPDEVTDQAIDAVQRHPQKRVVAHFMQPHQPFVGHEGLQFGAWDTFEEVDATLEGGDRRFRDVWEAASDGVAEPETVWSAYEDNLAFAMPAVNRLLASLPAGTKAVITADHGNVIDSRSWPAPITVSGHPRGLRLPGLVTVPWAEYIAGRQSITDGGVHSGSIDPSTDVEQRLEAFGYR